MPGAPCRHLDFPSRIKAGYGPLLYLRDSKPIHHSNLYPCPGVDAIFRGDGGERQVCRGNRLPRTYAMLVSCQARLKGS